MKKITIQLIKLNSKLPKKKQLMQDLNDFFKFCKELFFKTKIK